MPSNLSCVGLGVSESSTLDALIAQALPRAEPMGRAGDIAISRWQDISGARLVFGTRDAELVDLLPSYAALPGAELTDCRMLNDEVAQAAVVDETGEQLTSMAFELEQRRRLARVDAPVSGPAAVIALGVDVAVYRDAEAFELSGASLVDPNADPDSSPPPHFTERGFRWPPRMASESFISFGIFGEPAAARAHAQLAGTVLHATKRTVALTGQTFVTARVRTVGFEADVCLDSRSCPESPAPGQVIAGTVFLVVSVESLGFGDAVAGNTSRRPRWGSRRRR